MSYPPATRDRARELYVQDGWPYLRIAEEIGVAKTTLLRWSRTEDWDELRDLQAEARRRSRQLLVSAVRAATDSADPQQVYAAMQAAKLAGVVLGTASRHPAPKAVAVVLLDQLARHPEIGPVVRRFRNEVIRLVLEEVSRMEPGEGGA